MKVGNVSQTVLKRSVLKQLHTKRKEILTDLSVEEMCTAVQIRDTEDVVFASAVVSGNSKTILLKKPILAVAKTPLNDGYNAIVNPKILD